MERDIGCGTQDMMDPNGEYTMLALEIGGSRGSKETILSQLLQIPPLRKEE